MAPSHVRLLFAELKRRRVYRVVVVYVAVAWLLLQLGDTVVEPLRLPEWTLSLLIVLLVAGFPVAVVLAWAFEVTPEGVRRTEALGPAGAGAGAGDPAPGSEKIRNAALIGLGMLIAVLAIGTYGFFQNPQPHSSPSPREAGEFLSLAVLPFTNSSPDADNEFFADGVMEDILTHLALVPDFAVVSRTTVMRYKESSLSVPEIAAELEVRYVLEGSVRRAGDQVRITAQLVDGQADQHVWAETYDRGLEDVFAVQTEIATSIAGALEAELSRGVASRIERPPTNDLEAYDLFLRGREDYYRYTQGGTERAIEAFRAALERDPDFALARAWLGRAFALYAINHSQGIQWADSALAQTRRATSDQPDLAAAHTALGTALAARGRYAEAETALERAVELNPNDWAAISNLGLVYGLRGRQDEGIRLTLRSLEREPARSHLAHGNLGSYYSQIGLLDRARASAERALELVPDYPSAIYQSGWLHLLGGRRDQGLAVADRLAEAGPQDLHSGLLAGELYAMARDPERAAEVLAPVYEASPTAVNASLVGVSYGWALRELGRADQSARVLSVTETHGWERIASGDENPRFPYSLAGIHALRGEEDEALRRLAQAEELGWVVPEWPAMDPAMEGLHDDPRFQEILSRMEARQREMRETVMREGW